MHSQVKLELINAKWHIKVMKLVFFFCPMTSSGDGILCGGICMVFIIFQVKGFLTGSNQIPQMNLKGGAYNFATKEGGFFLLSRQVPPPRSWLLIQTLYIA